MTESNGAVKPLNKTQLTKLLAERCGISPKQATMVLDELNRVAVAELNKPDVGQFTFPGLLKLTKMVKPATPERQGKNPFTGAMVTFKAKPAKSVVKLRALKQLKDSVV